MGYEISASQLTEITKTGAVAFSSFLSEKEIQILKHSNGVRDSFLRCPLTKKIFIHRDLGKLLFEIIEKRPIRLVMTKKVSEKESFDLSKISIEEIYIAIYFSFNNTETIFFTKDYIPIFEEEGIIAIYGDARARYVKKEEDLDNAYLLKNGYSSGDKLIISQYPFIFK